VLERRFDRVVCTGVLPSPARPDRDAEEKRLFDTIDGRRTIAEIVKVARSEEAWPGAQALFEGLWWYATRWSSVRRDPTFRR
jgi:hypothetical protein